MATRGLIEFRSGNPVNGRKCYDIAISNAERLKDWHKSVAQINLAFELLRRNVPDAQEARTKALAEANKIGDAWIKALANRLKSITPTDNPSLKRLSFVKICVQTSVINQAWCEAL